MEKILSKITKSLKKHHIVCFCFKSIESRKREGSDVPHLLRIVEKLKYQDEDYFRIRKPGETAQFGSIFEDFGVSMFLFKDSMLRPSYTPQSILFEKYFLLL